ncbi:MAG: hypothetical protein GXP54_08875 [Deltaproteobacteria bacterium]|nr:hypothetical protein [Deltaproteobacteria bacterium]
MTARIRLREAGIAFLAAFVACSADVDRLAEDVIDATADTGPGDVPEEVEADTGPLQCVDPWVGVPWDDAADTTFLRGPYIQSVFSDSAVVVWRTQDVLKDEGCVHYWVDSEEKVSCDLPDKHGQYEVTLTGLSPYTMVPYRVTVEGAGLETMDLKFRTAPDDPRPVRMLVFADSHINTVTMPKIAASALADGTDLAVGVGDLVNQAEEAQWDVFFNGLRPLLHRVPLWAVLGNHEARGQSYFDAFVVPGASPDPPKEVYYSVRWGNVWFAALEVVELDVAYWLQSETPMVNWLKEQLSSPAAREARWRFLFIHEPPWCVGWGHCDNPVYQGEKSVREILVPIAVDYGVTAIFDGHMHGYGHGVKDGLNLFIAGGAGGALDHGCPLPPPEVGLPQPWTEVYEHHRLRVDAGCDLLVVQALALDDDETVIDRVEIPYQEPPPLP